MTAREFPLFFNNLCVSRASQPAQAVKDGAHVLKYPRSDHFCNIVEGFASLVSHIGVLKRMEALFSVYSSLAPQHFVTSPVAVLIREAHQNGLSDLLGTGHGPILGQRWKPMVSPRFPSEVYRLQFLETSVELIIAPLPFCILS